MKEPKDQIINFEEYYPSSEEISTAILSRIGNELGDISLKDLITYAVHEGVQFGADISRLGDDFILDTDTKYDYHQTVEEALPDDESEHDRTVVPITHGRVIKQKRARRK